MIIKEIPLVTGSQVFKITLGTMRVKITIHWRGGRYFIDIADAKEAFAINGIALVTGCDLLEQFKYLGFSGSLVLVSDVDNPYPTFTSLGDTDHLLWVTNG